MFRLLSILFESYCNATKRASQFIPSRSFNSLRVLLQPARTGTRPPPSLLSILFESYCNLWKRTAGIFPLLLSILFESYCNWATLSAGSASEDTFNSLRVLLQLADSARGDVRLQLLSILFESYCNRAGL